jgi:hypothetical protein
MSGHADEPILRLIGTAAVLIRNQDLVDEAREAYRALVAEHQRLRDALERIERDPLITLGLAKFIRDTLAGTPSEDT